MVVMHAFHLIHKCLNYTLYTTVFQDQRLKMALISSPNLKDDLSSDPLDEQIFTKEQKPHPLNISNFSNKKNGNTSK